MSSTATLEIPASDAISSAIGIKSKFKFLYCSYDSALVDLGGICGGEAYIMKSTSCFPHLA